MNKNELIGREQTGDDNNDNNRCPECKFRWQYLSGQRYCPTCDLAFAPLEDTLDEGPIT